MGIGAATRAKPEVSALLDPQQYAAISAPPEQPLLVLGSAGSGKTTVALHRLARIAAVEPHRYPLAQARVVVPEEGLARLSRRLLEPLGVTASHVQTAERWVTELARRLLGTLAPRDTVQAAREGAPVGIFRLPTEAQAQLFLAGALRDLVDREPRASVGVIAADEGGARRVHSVIADMPEARLVLRGEFGFEPGIDVTDVDNAKGLEFDYVVVPDGTAASYPRTDEARHRLHVAVTRAAHQLWVVAGGAPSPLLAGEE